jgi:hypothetical protein
MADRTISLRRALIKIFSSLFAPAIAELADFNDVQQNVLFSEERPRLAVSCNQYPSASPPKQLFGANQ